MDPVSPVQPQPAPAAPAKETPKAPKKKMSRKTKIWLIVVAVVVLIGAGFFFGRYRCFRHSFGSNCEFGALDGGMKCVSDMDCSSNLCIYSTDPNAVFDSLLGGSGEVEPKSDHGYCDTYEGDNDGVTICHRPSPGGKLACFSVMSQGPFDLRLFASK